MARHLEIAVRRRKALQKYKELLKESGSGSLIGESKLPRRVVKEYLEENPPEEKSPFRLDADRDKTVSKVEFYACMGAASEEEIRKIEFHEACGQDGKKAVSKEEFMKLHEDWGLEEQTVKEAFRECKNSNGELDQVAYYKAKEVAFSSKRPEIEEKFEEMQEDGRVPLDGALDLETVRDKIVKRMFRASRHALNKDEFMVLNGVATAEERHRVMIRQLRDAFKALDRDDDGFFDLEDFQKAYEEQGYEFSPPEEAEKLYKLYVPIQEGVSYERFYKRELQPQE